MEALSSANFFIEGSKTDPSLELLLGALLKNLDYDSKLEASKTPQSPFPAMPTPASLGRSKSKTSSIADLVATNAELKAISERCLILILKNINGTTLKGLVTASFKLLEISKRLNNFAFLTDFVPLIIANSEPQYHFVVISYALERLESESHLLVRTTFVYMLNYLIATGTLAGLTIPELLDTFSKRLLESTKSVSGEEGERAAFQFALTQAIGNILILN